MDMKKKMVFIMIICSVFFTMKVGITQDEIPAYNRKLFELYPDIHVEFPQVPRITAAEALVLYKSGLAFFLGCGHHNSAVPGGLYVEDGSTINIERLKATVLRNKLLIVYCH